MTSYIRKLWIDWFPEEVLAAVLAGETVIPNIGQVQGCFKVALEREVKAGRLAKWKGKWHPVAGSHFGMGPDKDCYGTPEIAAEFAAIRAAELRA